MPDFRGLKLTNNRQYNSDNLKIINQAFQYLPLKQRAALLASIAEESGAYPNSVSPDKVYQGLLQWKSDRYRFPKDTANILEEQISLIKKTLNDTKRYTTIQSIKN